MGKAELKIEIDEGVLEQARAAGVDVDATLEHALRRELAARAEAKRWAEENAEALRLYEERIKKYGVFGEDFRTW